MGFFYTPLPLWLAIAGWLAGAATLICAACQHPFRRLAAPPLQDLWLGLIVALSVLWAINAWLSQGPVIHLLGATLMVTLFDWALALLAMAATIGLTALVFDASWLGVGMSFLVLGAVPVIVSALTEQAIAAWLPRHMLVFILGHGFATAALALLAACAATVGVHIILHGGVVEALPARYALELCMMALGEAWFCGMLTMVFAVYRPAWITAHDVRRYQLTRGPHT